ncbi:MAG: terminase gpA endonuclease subunit [Planctomycetota bacterium]
MIATLDNPGLSIGRELIAASRRPRFRPILEWAEAEVVIPKPSPRPGRYRAATQPAVAMFLHELADDHWRDTAFTGIAQGGKSLHGYVLPGLHALFELRESVVCGVPTMDMSGDKWRNDFLPIIEASRYRDLLPADGAGSRGGEVDAIRFRHGVELKFMSAGGSDKKRAGYTARIILQTEVDGYDEVRRNSREADPATQMEARGNAFGDRRRVYRECTVSIERGRIWTAYQHGSASRLALPCPRCGGWVTPEREHLVGWQDAEDEDHAAEGAHLVCPSCGGPWSEDERLAANREARLVHRGQEVTADGEVVGPRPRTRTLGFRFTCVNDCLNSMASVGRDEWLASRELNAEVRDRALRQFRWVVPIESEEKETNELDHHAIAGRWSDPPRGVLLPWMDAVAVGVDVGHHLLHWTAVAGRLRFGDDPPDDERWVQLVDYGIAEVHTRQLGLEPALRAAFAALNGDLPRRLTRVTADGEVAAPAVEPALWGYDSGDGEHTPSVYRHCREMGPAHLPLKGFGFGQRAGAAYRGPARNGRNTRKADGYYVERVESGLPGVGRVTLLELDANLAKSRLHDRLSVPVGTPGAVMLPRPADNAAGVPTPGEHTSFTKQLLAERSMQARNKQGAVETVWGKTPGHSGGNHFLDSTAYALVLLDRLRRQANASKRRATGAWAPRNGNKTRRT